MKYKTALIIGRFQPFHLGHLYLLKETLKIADKVVFGIGSASIFDENNPMDYETRRKIIKAVFYKEKIEDRLLKIVPLEDFFNDEKWLNNLKEKVGKFDVVVSNNDWTNNIMEKAGYKVKRFPYYKRELYEGWRIRKLINNQGEWQKRVPDYLINFIKNNIQEFIIKDMIFNHIVIGGTFDHFHKGHEELIKTAFHYGKKITIGIASEELYKNKIFSQSIESFKVRKKSVSDFLKKNTWRSRAKIIPFSEFTGGADKNKEVDAIVVSRLTYPNALRINELRVKNNFNKLRIIIIKDILSEDKKLLSSERIRSGEIDRRGKSYELGVMGHLEKGKKELIMPEELREELRKPLGRVFKTINGVVKFVKSVKPLMIIAVGDVIVDSLLKKDIDPDIKIIDFKSRRENISFTHSNNQLKKEKQYTNKPGTINFKTSERLKQLIRENKNKWLVIEGEEDLLTLPAILYAPLGSLVLYGHWKLGVIGVFVTLENKNRIFNIIKTFNYFK